MINLFRAELHKIFRSKAFRFTVLISLGFSAIMFMLLSFGESSASVYGKKQLMAVLANQGMIILIIGVFSSMYISEEFTSGFIRNYVSVGHDRFKILFTKSIVTSLAGGVIAISNYLVNVLASSIIYGYGPELVLSEINHLVVVILLSTLVFIAVGSLATAFTFVIKNNGLSFIAFYSCSFFSQIATAFLLDNEFFTNILNKSIFVQINLLLKQTITMTDITTIVLVSLTTIVLSIGVSSLIFTKQDIK